MLLDEVVRCSAEVASTPARLGKVARLAALLRRTSSGEAAVVATWLSGSLRQRAAGVGWASVRTPPAPAAAPSLHVREVDDAFAAIGALGGAGSQKQRADHLAALLGRATATEQAFLARLVVGEVRQGAQEGIVVDATARAAGVPVAALRRARMLAGDLGEVVEAALHGGGEQALAAYRLHVGRPVQPMLAQAADGVEDAFGGDARQRAVEWKVDGARIQAHRSDDAVAVFTRTLDDITSRVPEVVEAVLALPAVTAVLDGEVIALLPDGRPRPFQQTMARVGSRKQVDGRRGTVPLTPYFFDALHLDGDDLLDRPASARAAALAEAVPAHLVIPRIVTADPASAEAFARDAVARGHEGVMVKDLDAPYEAGRRGAAWRKVKPAHTLDLVVLAAEWGHGRRRGLLSNLHLGARDQRSGGFVMLGKTFKGLTDAVLAWQTGQLLAREAARDGATVYVRPELVVEVAFDGVQASTRYAGGVALRFARVKRYRPDKRADQADTIDTVRAIHRAGIDAGIEAGPAARGVAR